MSVPFVRPVPTAQQRAHRKLQHEADRASTAALINADRERRHVDALEKLRALGDVRGLDRAGFQAAMKHSLRLLRSAG